VKILLLDIETAPNIAYVWGLFKQNISLNAIANSGYVLCWAAKWLGEEKIMFSSVQTGKKKMLKEIHDLLAEADVVIHYYGSRFDIPTLNKEFVQNDMLPPASYKQLDLLMTVRKQFRFPSAKLEYVAKALGIKQKVEHAGFQMWIDCMNNDEAAWEQMKEYNIGDIQVLEDLYNRLLPWIKNHPNVGLYKDAENVCPNCGGNHLERRGFAYTVLGKFQRFQCKGCGTWSRDKKSMAVKNILQQDKT
jgi:DNA polymerase elongation subunit (family B)